MMKKTELPFEIGLILTLLKIAVDRVKIIPLQRQMLTMNGAAKSNGKKEVVGYL
jgi:hypothetical protein